MHWFFSCCLGNLVTCIMHECGGGRGGRASSRSRFWTSNISKTKLITIWCVDRQFAEPPSAGNAQFSMHREREGGGGERVRLEDHKSTNKILLPSRAQRTALYRTHRTLKILRAAEVLENWQLCVCVCAVAFPFPLCLFANFSKWIVSASFSAPPCGRTRRKLHYQKNEISHLPRGGECRSHATPIDRLFHIA